MLLFEDFGESLSKIMSSLTSNDLNQTRKPNRVDLVLLLLTVGSYDVGKEHVCLVYIPFHQQKPWPSPLPLRGKCNVESH